LNGEKSSPGPHLIVTLGAYGSLLITRDSMDVFAPALPAEAISELGAGDAFIAGMIAELLAFAKQNGKSAAEGDGHMTADFLSDLKEADWRRVLTVANAVGALSTRSMTAWEGLPTQEELSLLVKTVA